MVHTQLSPRNLANRITGREVECAVQQLAGGASLHVAERDPGLLRAVAGEQIQQTVAVLDVRPVAVAGARPLNR